MKRELLASLMDVKKAAIIRVMLNSKEEMILKEIAEQSKVPIATVFRITKELVELQILTKREWKTSKVYSCQKNDKVTFLKDLFHEDIDGVAEFVEAVKDIQGIQNIIQHGDRTKTSANIVLIGHWIDEGALDEIRKDLKLKGFNLGFGTVTKAQYESMGQMGVFKNVKTLK